MRELFLENSQIAVLISSSKFIMTERLLNNKRGFVVDLLTYRADDI